MWFAAEPHQFHVSIVDDIAITVASQSTSLSFWSVGPKVSL
jgi:hypothetical protein